MKRHEPFLELAAMGLDFPLTATERARLDQHLAVCPACARAATGFRADAALLERLPVPMLPERRAAEILATVLHPQPIRHPVRLLALAALLGLALVGTLVAGAELIRERDRRLVLVPPLPSGSALAAESPGQPSPEARPAPSPTPAPASDPVLRMDWAVDTRSPVDATVVMDDGLVAWNDPADGLQQRHLTPSGLAWVRETLSDNGLLEGDAIYQAKQRPGTDPPGGGATTYTFVSSVDGSAPVTVSVGMPTGYEGSWFDEYYTASETLRRLFALGEQVVDADAWIPERYWADAAAPYDPARYLFVVRTSGQEEPGLPDVDTVEWPLPVPPDEYGDLLASDNGEPQWRCAVVDRALASALAEAMASSESDVADTLRGREHLYGWSRGSGSVGVQLERLLPNEVDCSARHELPEPPGLGSTWSSATVPDDTDRPSGPIEAVTAGGPGFVAVGRGCMGAEPECEAIVWTSADGRAWTRVAAADALDTGAFFSTSGPEIGMFDVAAGGPGIVAIGYAARPDMEATAWFSPDGSSWERIPLGGVGTTRVNAVTFDGRRFVIVGEDRSAFNGANLATAAARAAAWTSEDGRTWSPVPPTDAFDVGGFVDTTEDPWMGGMTDVTAGPSGLVAVGSVCEHGMDTSGGRPLGCQATVWRSPDGRSWDRAVGVTQEPALINAVAASEDGYIAVGTSLCGRGSCRGLVLTSPDAETWTPRSFPQPGEIASVTRVGDRFFATTPSGEVQLWTSADGTAWEPADVEGGPTALDPGGDVQLAAGDGAAVWIGTPGDADGVVAWVSTAGPGSAP